jgi:hypothetical protein
MKTVILSNRGPKRSTFLLLPFCFWILGQPVALAATIPTGTTIVVTMVGPLSSHERPGRTFETKLATDLKAGGKTVAPAGTIIFGVVEKSRNAMGVRTTTEPLTLNLKSIAINGQRIPIKTTGGVAPETVSGFTGLQKRTGVSAGKSVLHGGTKLQFRLAEPLNL